jgi:hypothetical protein
MLIPAYAIKGGVDWFSPGEMFFSKGPDLVEMRAFFQQMALECISAAELTFTGGPFVGQTGWWAGVDYTAGHTNRDAIMMLLNCPEAFSDVDVVRLMNIALACQGVVDDGVQTGMFLDGTVYGYGGQTGTPSDLDNAFYLIIAAREVARREGNASKFLAHESRFIDAFNYVPVDQHLAYNPPAGPTPPGWGFNDSEIITGHDSMLTNLRFAACRCLSELYTMAGQPVKAAIYTSEMDAIPAKLEELLYDEASGLLRFGTGAGNGNNPLLSLNASAYAVVTGTATATMREGISQAFLDLCPGYPSELDGWVGWYSGQQRHFPDFTGFSVWRTGSIPLGTYQNGGGWATMSGAGYYALGLKSPAEALQRMWEWYQFCKPQASNYRPVEALNVNGTVQSLIYGASNQPYQYARYLLDGDPFIY